MQERQTEIQCLLPQNVTEIGTKLTARVRASLLLDLTPDGRLL
jgi:hypothetical protein